MPEPSLIPPLRVRTPSGSFNQIPVFELEVSGGEFAKAHGLANGVIFDA